MCAMEARPYQKECVELINKTETGRHLVSLATGLGKTVIMSLIDRPGRMLILSHRDELVHQPEKYFTECTFGIEKAEEHSHGEDVVSASVQSLSKDNRLNNYAPDEFHTIIVDEAHHAAAPTYKKVLDHFVGAKKVIGLTATPKRGDNVRLDDVFDDILYARDLRWGIENKYLSRVRCMEVEGGYSLKGVKKQTGDYSNSDVERRITEDVLCIAAKTYIDVCLKQNRHTLIYCVTVQKCMELMAILKKMLPEEKKESIQMVTGQTDQEERKQILSDFSEGKIDAIINCMVLTEGTDLPICDTILNLRPTCNASLYQQMVGRGTRLHDGKVYCLVLDIIPDDGSGARSLCTAPTLFGVDPEFLSQKSKKRLNENEDLLSLCDEIAGESMEITKMIDITLREVDAFVEERETLIKKVASAPSATFRDLANGYYALAKKNEDSAEDTYDFGDLHYEIQPSEEKRYLIHADWHNTITISKPDIMGQATIDFFVDGKHHIGEMRMDQAISLAQDYCYTVPRYMWYSWSRSMQKSWEKEQATDAQQKKLYASYTSEGISKGTNSVSKLDASRLIEMKEQVNEKRKFLKKYKPEEKNRAVTVKKKKDALAAWLEEDNKKRLEGKKDFDVFKDQVTSASRNIKEGLEREKKERERIQNQIKKDGILKFQLVVSTGIDPERQASDKQISYSESLFRKVKTNAIFMEGYSQSSFKTMKMREISMFITLMRHLTENMRPMQDRMILTEQSVRTAVSNVMDTKQETIICEFELVREKDR